MMFLKSIASKVISALAFIFVIAFNSTYSHGVSGSLVPDSGVLLTIGQDVDSINDYVSTVGVQPGGATNYIGIVNLDGLRGNADAGAGRNNVTELASTYPNSALVVGVSMNGQVGAVAAGNYNGNIDTVLNTLGSFNQPVYLRWAYEVDGPWNNHNPNDIRTTFRYVHQRIRDLGYENKIALVWQVASYCPTAGGQLNQWYPGDQYVDWIGLSYFAPQDCNWDRVNEAAQFARSHNKPLFINESTPQRYQISDLTYSSDPAQGTNRVSKTAQQIWNEWFARYFQFINDYSDVMRAITYINADWDQQPRWGDLGDGYGEGYWGDSRVQANSTIRTNWLNETNQSKYIKLSDNLFDILNYGGSVTPPPPPPPPGGTETKVEAETASLANGAQVYNDGSASGGQGVAYLNNLNSSMTLSNVPASTSIRVQYASQLSGGISVYVNGADVGTLNFNSTGSWVGNYSSTTLNLNIPAGATFALRNNSGDSALNVDFITFISSD